MKQLTFGAKFAPPRPNLNMPIIQEMYMNHIIQIIMDWSCEDENDKQAYEEIKAGVTKFLKYERDNVNGYEVARYLEDYCHLEPDSNLVNDLDNLPSFKRQTLLDLLSKWIEDYNIVPLLKIGDKATFGDTVTEITAIDHKGAVYYAYNGRRALPFEEVKEHMAALEAQK